MRKSSHFVCPSSDVLTEAHVRLQGLSSVAAHCHSFVSSGCRDGGNGVTASVDCKRLDDNQRQVGLAVPDRDGDNLIE